MVWGLSFPLSTAGWRSQAATVKEAICIWAQKRAGSCSCEEQERPDETQGQTLRQRALSPSIATWAKASQKAGCQSASWLATCSSSHTLNSLIRVQYQCSNISPCHRIIEPQNYRIPGSLSLEKASKIKCNHQCSTAKPTTKPYSYKPHLCLLNTSRHTS